MGAIYSPIFFELKKVAANSVDAAHSISRNISEDQYERLDQLHDKVENALLKLIGSLQKKQARKQWEDKLQPK